MLVIKASYLNRLLALSFLFAAYDVNSTSFTPNNLLVQSQIPGALGFHIREFDLDGNEKQSLLVPQPPGQTEYLHPRDLSLDNNDSLHLYNGTFEPYLSSYNLLSESWIHTTTLEWNTVNNVSYGGLATYSSLVFVTDMSIGGDASGIVAFDTVASSATRFATDINPIDLNIGLDGQLYALSGNTVSIYDPESFLFKGNVYLSGGGDIRAIAIDKAGNIYAASWEGTLSKYDSSGVIVKTIVTASSAIDLDISGDGILALGTRLNGIFITDTDFSTSSNFNNGDWNSFVTFVPVESPVRLVEIDIKPYEQINNINPRSRGLLPVAVLTSGDFDALLVDPATVRFGPAGAIDTHGRAHVKDIDNDGDMDLLFHFSTRETGISCGDTEATLTGQTWDGTLISGTDSVNTVSCR